MKKTLIVSLSLLSFFNAIASAGPSTKNPAGLTISSYGNVTAASSNQPARQLKRRSLFFSRDTISTMNRSSGIFKFKDGTVVRLYPKSKMKISKFKAPSKNRTGSLNLYVNNNSKLLYMSGSLTKEKIRLRTALGVLGIRGTNVLVSTYKVPYRTRQALRQYDNQMTSVQAQIRLALDDINKDKIQIARDRRNLTSLFTHVPESITNRYDIFNFLTSDRDVFRSLSPTIKNKIASWFVTSHASTWRSSKSWLAKKLPFLTDSPYLASVDLLQTQEYMRNLQSQLMKLSFNQFQRFTPEQKATELMSLLNAFSNGKKLERLYDDYARIQNKIKSTLKYDYASFSVFNGKARLRACKKSIPVDDGFTVTVNSRCDIRTIKISKKSLSNLQQEARNIRSTADQKVAGAPLQGLRNIQFQSNKKPIPVIILQSVQQTAQAVPIAAP